MPMIYPEATPAEGNTKVVFVLGDLDTPTAPKLATEINDATSLDVSLFIRDWNPVLTANTGTAPPRLAAPVQTPREGKTQLAPIELRYPYDPQGDDTTDDNKLKAMVPRGTELTAVVRKGPDANLDPFAIGDKTESWKFKAGKQNKVRSSDDEFSEFEISQMFYPQREAIDGVVVA